jgi:hypothetical protein
MPNRSRYFRKPFSARTAGETGREADGRTRTGSANQTPDQLSLPMEQPVQPVKPSNLPLNSASDPVIREKPRRNWPVVSPFLTTKEAAAYLRLSPRSIERLRVDGNGPPYKKCGNGKKAKVLYAIDDLDAWLVDARRSTSTADG